MSARSLRLESFSLNLFPLPRLNPPSSAAPPPAEASSIYQTTPISDSTDPANASPHETHAAPADKPPAPSPHRTSSTRDITPGFAPADQSYPHRLATPASASSHP